jgi:APA family basic amino acid/polyamine antiporter
LPPVLLVIICSYLLCRGTKESATTNAVMVVIKLAVLLFFVVIAFSGFDAKNFFPFFNTDNSAGLAGMAGVTAASGTVFFSFIGLDTIATAGAEVNNPKRNVPIGILAALGIVTVFYLLVAVAAVGAQPAAKFVGQEAGLAVILQDVTGRTWPALVLSAGAVISVFSITLVSIYGQTRILYAVSRDGLAPPVFKQVNARTAAPVRNTMIVSTVVGIAAGLVDANFMWDMVSMGTLTAFIVVAIAVPVMRAKDDGSRSGGFRIPFGPYVVPVLSVLACLYIMKDLSTLTFQVFAVWMVAAVALYFMYGMANSRLGKP